MESRKGTSLKRRTERGRKEPDRKELKRRRKEAKRDERNSEKRAGRKREPEGKAAGAAEDAVKVHGRAGTKGTGI